MSKIFEKLLMARLLQYLEPIIPPTQFGFRPAHSCAQQLHRVVDEILDTYEEKNVCLGLFLDTEKAFDRVWHDGLLAKLKPHLPDTLFLILASYLSKRTFSVKCEDAVSKSYQITAGVPQGSVLGPLLYLVYAHDYPIGDSVKIAHYADDVAALAKGISSEQAHSRLQELANQVEQWCSDWRVKVNASKSHLVQFTYRKRISHPQITIGGCAVPYTPETKYLGLILDEKLVWNSHISSTVQKTRTRMYALQHLLKSPSLNLHSKKLIYLLLIRPVWQYGSVIWGSASDSQIKRVQTVQNRILRLITGAPWYVKNSTIHNDLDIPEVKDVIQRNYERHHQRLSSHSNDLLTSITENPPPLRVERRLKRKRHSDLAPT